MASPAWNPAVDGAPPGVVVTRNGFVQTGIIKITDSSGDWYGVTDGTIEIKVVLVKKSAARLAQEAAEKPAADAITQAITDARTAQMSSHSALADTVAWAALTSDQKLELLRAQALGIKAP